MKKQDYKEQLESPNWQRRRLEIMGQDNFTCQICGNKDKQLHVHHTTYIPGRDIWDYDDFQLITLCKDCHEKEHNSKEFEDIISGAIQNARLAGITKFELNVILRWLYFGKIDLMLGREIKDLSKVKETYGLPPNGDIILENLKRLQERRNSIKNNIKLEDVTNTNNQT